MSAIFSVLATLIVVAQSRSSPLFVTYVSAPYPTCGGVTDGDCLARLGVPGYGADHKYNIVNLAFYVPDGAAGLADATAVWNNPGAYMSSSFKQTLTGSSSASASQIRTAIKKKFSDAGVKLLLSVFGGTSHPMNAFSEASITQSNGLCDKIADVVLEQQYDGVDVDFEQTAYFQSGTAESWLCTLTNCLREKLGWSKIISHAPQAPYMGASYGSSAHYPNGGYLKVHQLCGSKIDFYNVQFYNQGSTTYDSFQTLFNTANGWSASTAIYQIINGQNNNGGLSIPADKLVVGKFIRQGVDGSAGWMSASTAKTVFQTAISNSNPSWNTGFMTWQIYGDALTNYAWSNEVASAWGNSPVSAPVSPPSSPASSPVTRPTPNPTPAPTRGSTGSGVYIDVTLFYNSDWWLTCYLENTNGISITTLKIKASNYNSYLSTNVGWVDSNHGPIYGFSVSPDMRAPFSIKMISSSGQEISSSNILEVRAAGASGTMTQRMGGSSFTESDDGSDTVAWTVWFAIIFCALLLIGCGIGFICYRKKKANKQVAFDHGHKNHDEIEIGDGATNTQI